MIEALNSNYRREAGAFVNEKSFLGKAPVNSYFSHADMGETPIHMIHKLTKHNINNAICNGTPVAYSKRARSNYARRIERMGNAKKNILIIEGNPILRNRFNSAFMHSGYDVQITDRNSEAVEMVSSGIRSARPFDLVVVDISDGKHLDLVADVQNINSKLPVFTLKDAADKTMVINLLNHKQTEFIEHFMQAHARA